MAEKTPKLTLDTFNEILLGALKEGVDPKKAQIELLEMELETVMKMFDMEAATLGRMVKKHAPYSELEAQAQKMENILSNGEHLENVLAELTGEDQ